jgi:predicted transcriptional regulator
MRRIEIRNVHKDNVVHTNPKLGSVYVVDFFENAEYFGTKKFRNVPRSFIDRINELWVNGEIQHKQIPLLKESIDLTSK